MYKSEMHNAKETKEILEKGSPDVFFRWYYKKKEEPDPGGKTVRTSRIDKLEGRMDQFERRMDQFEGRFDRIEESINKLARIVEDGFKQVNTRIDNLERRLDYIVSANKLKDLQKSKR